MKRQVSAVVGIGLGAAVVFGVTTLTNVTTACAADPISFNQDVFPIFKGRCVGCHAAGAEGYEKSGLDLTTYEGLMKGTKVGPMVIPGDPGSSNLIWLLDWKAKPALRMPHGNKKLSTCDRDAIRTWIRQGAKNN